MPNPDIRLILTDIDGTILPYGQRVVSERTRKAFHAAQAAGIHVGPASGRGFSHVPASFDGDVSCSSTCLATNGMEVYLDGELIHRAYIGWEATEHIARALDGVPHAGLIYFEDGLPVLVTGDVEDLAQSFPMYARECRRQENVPHHDFDKVNVFVAGGMDHTRVVFDLLVAKVPEIDFNIPMDGFINTLPRGWSKASGIDVLCEALGIGLDQVVVFGDGGNDVEMLAHVPNSVAVADAAPEAAEAARWHVGRCEDEAVAAAIEVLAAGDWPFA